LKTNNFLQEKFVEWFNKPENFKPSYDGLVTVKVLNSWNDNYFEGRLFDLDTSDLARSVSEIEKYIGKENTEWHKFSQASSNGAPEAILGKNNYLRFLSEFIKGDVSLLNLPNPKQLINNSVEKFKNVTFQSLKEAFPEVFKEIYDSEMKWMADIENKLHHIIKEIDRDAVQDVINKLKNKDYVFDSSDEANLATFSRVIDKTIKASNFINNFTIENLKRDGLTIYDFFNKIKNADKLNVLNTQINLTSTLRPILPYYFSAVKNCQAPGEYPIHYKYWYVLLNKVLNKGSDYDSLTEFYHTLPKENRLRNFFAFFGALGKAILLNIKDELHNDIIDKAFSKRLAKIITLTNYINEVFKVEETGAEKNGGEVFEKEQIEFNPENFFEDSLNSNFYITNKLCSRFIASLLTKPFVILTGLSGSGKTKLAQAFAMWICENENQYCISPVGSDWTNREPLLGFPNALEDGKYVKPDSGVLDLIIEASKKENEKIPFFLILDEMNLSHVERYFADFLSVMETKEKISLHSGNEKWGEVPAELELSKNLFIIGTVNIDETTYMFSPKVLDRANVIEFRVTADEMDNFLNNYEQIDLDHLESEGSNMSESFLDIALDEDLRAADIPEINETLLNFFAELKETGAEFGYRSASEILRFVAVVNKIAPTWSSEDIIDAAIMQKLLPKVHGSRRKLESVLISLGKLCLQEEQKLDNYILPNTKIDYEGDPAIKHPISLEKILRMYHNLISNGFTSYAEA
jgi:hypothetical protein